MEMRARRARPYTAAEHEALIDWGDIIKHKSWANQTMCGIYDRMPRAVRDQVKEDTKPFWDWIKRNEQIRRDPRRG